MKIRLIVLIALVVGAVAAIALYAIKKDAEFSASVDRVLLTGNPVSVNSRSGTGFMLHNTIQGQWGPWKARLENVSGKNSRAWLDLKVPVSSSSSVRARSNSDGSTWYVFEPNSPENGRIISVNPLNNKKEVILAEAVAGHQLTNVFDIQGDHLYYAVRDISNQTGGRIYSIDLTTREINLVRQSPDEGEFYNPDMAVRGNWLYIYKCEYDPNSNPPVLCIDNVGIWRRNYSTGSEELVRVNDGSYPTYPDFELSEDGRYIAVDTSNGIIVKDIVSGSERNIGLGSNYVNGFSFAFYGNKTLVVQPNHTNVPSPIVETINIDDLFRGRR